MKNSISKIYSALLVAMCCLVSVPVVKAQITPSTNFYNSGTTTFFIPPCPVGCTTTDDLESINSDMYELDPVFASGGYEEKLYGITWTGGVSGLIVDQSYAWLYTTLGGTPLNIKIPAVGSYLDAVSATAHQSDIAVGKYYDPGAGIEKYFVIVVYEALGDIWFESYDLSVTGTGVSIIGQHQPYAYMTPPCPGGICVAGGQMLLSNFNGTASYPHIDVIYDNHGAGGGDADAVAVRYVVSWEDAGSIYNAEGTLFNTPSFVTNIGNGSFPDIGGISNIDIAGSAPSFNEDMVYTTYIESGSGDLVLAERKWADPTVNTIQLEIGSGATNTIYYPRIATPVCYDFANTSNTEPVSLVVAPVEFSGSGYTAVHSYTYDDPAGTPGNNNQTISEYNSNTTFSGTPYNSSMPVITGAGVLNTNDYITGGGTPFEEYPVIFYSDGTWTGSMGSGNGDLYGSNIDPATLNPTGFYNGNFSEVNFEPFFAPFDMVATPKPLLSASTSTNSNFDLLVAYWDGEEIYWKDMGGISNYANYKPGKPTGINETANKGFKVFPNPVKNQLNIAHANGAGYTVMDMTGRSISTGTLSGNNATVDASTLAPGMYILQLTKDTHTEKLKFVKQ